MQEKTLVIQKENPSRSVESSSDTLTTIVSSSSSEEVREDANQSFLVSFYVTNTITD
jgi:hypothetical protein